MTQFSGDRLLPGAGDTLPGFDPEWETHALRVDDGGDSGNLELSVGPGETVSFAAMVALSGSGSCTVTVSTPVSSNGGFYVQGLDDAGDYKLISYGADNFNSATADSWQVGIAGTLEGWSVLRVEGMVGSSTGGLIRITTSSGTIKAGSFIKGYRIHDARGYGA